MFRAADELLRILGPGEASEADSPREKSRSVSAERVAKRGKGARGGTKKASGEKEGRPKKAVKPVRVPKKPSTRGQGTHSIWLRPKHKEHNSCFLQLA